MATKSGRKTTKKGAARKTGRKTARKTGKKATAKKKTGTKTARKRAAKAPARKPPRKSASKNPKQRLAQLLERLDKLYGSIHLPETQDTLEKAVYLILREGLGAEAVRKALAVLRSEFVDWNEVRVTRPSELARLMLGTGRASTLRRAHPYAQRVSDMIDQVYNDRNDTPLEFLIDLKPAEQIEYLEDLDDLGLHNAYALVQWMSGSDKLLLVPSAMAQACQRLGLTASAAVTKVKKELSALVGPEPERLVTVQAHLNRLGELDDDEWPSILADFLS